MQDIDIEKMEKIKGGASFAGVALVVTAIVIFISGLINGYTNPERCGEK